jgi:hypothetical protein
MHTFEKRSRPQAKCIRESLGFDQETRKRRSSPQSRKARLRRAFHSLKKTEVSEERRARQGSTCHGNKHRAGGGIVPYASPGRDSWPLPELESPGQDCSHSSQSPAAEQLHQVGRFNGMVVRVPYRGGHGKCRGQRARGTHAEPLTDGKLVAECESEPPRPSGKKPASHLVGDR